MVQLKLSVMRLCLVMAVSVLVLAAQAAEKSRPLFADWLDQTTATGVPKARLTGGPAYGYDELEEEIGCLRATKYDGCRHIGCSDRCRGCFSPCYVKQFAQTHFTCAPEEEEYKSHDYKHKSHAFLGSSDLDVGYCDINFNLFGAPDAVVVAPNVTKFGTFYATCYLNKGADLCGHPFCDEMVITVEGSAYESSYVASYSNPVATPACENSTQRGAVPGIKSNPWSDALLRRHTPSKKNIPSKAGKHSVAQYDDNGPYGADGSGIEVIGVGPEGPAVPYDNDGPEGRVFVGWASVLSGPMRVTSRKYNLKTNQHGWFEFVIGFGLHETEDGTPVSLPASAAENCFVVKPYKAILKFSKAREGYDKQQEGPAGEEYKSVGYEDRY